VVVVVVQHSIASPSPPHPLRLPPSTYARSTAASIAAAPSSPSPLPSRPPSPSLRTPSFSPAPSPCPSCPSCPTSWSAVSCEALAMPTCGSMSVSVSRTVAPPPRISVVEPCCVSFVVPWPGVGRELSAHIARAGSPYSAPGTVCTHIIHSARTHTHGHTDTHT